MKLTVERLLLIIAAVVIFLLSLKTCKSSYQNQTDADTIDSLTLANQQLDSIKNKMGETIYYQESIVTNNQKAMKALTDSIFNLKRKDKRNREIISYYQNRTVTGIVDTLRIKSVDSARMKRFEDSLELKCQEVIGYYRDSAIEVPHSDSLMTEDLSLSYTINKEEGKPVLSINKLSFPDTLDVVFQLHKGGLFKRKKIEVIFKHSNPYVKTIGSNSVTYVPRKKSQWVVKALLIGAGIFIGTKL